jgi:hypothetical protein
MSELEKILTDYRHGYLTFTELVARLAAFGGGRGRTLRAIPAPRRTRLSRSTG